MNEFSSFVPVSSSAINERAPNLCTISLTTALEGSNSNLNETEPFVLEFYLHLFLPFGEFAVRTISHFFFIEELMKA
jgi:hypothetical protein